MITIESNAAETLGADMPLWLAARDRGQGHESFGSINHALRNPGTTSPKDFRYSKWLGFVDPHLPMVNDYGRFLPWGLCDHFCNLYDGRPCFVRPDSGLKPFVGQPVRTREDWKTLQQLNAAMSPDEMVYIGPLYNIREEYRFFVWNGQIVASTQYLPEEKPADHIPDDVVRCARGTLCEILTLPIESTFTMDVAVLDMPNFKIPYILEFNCFRSSGFYAADQQAIIEAVAKGDM